LEIAQRPVHGSTSSPRAGMGTNGEWGSGRRAHGCECVDRTGWGEAGHEQPRAPASNSHPFVLSLSKDERGEAGDRTEARSWFDKIGRAGGRDGGGMGELQESPKKATVPAGRGGARRDKNYLATRRGMCSGSAGARRS